MKLRSEALWAALDRVAADHGLTASALARRAGLDPTTFNKSKRSVDGHDRWPSTQSIALVLQTVDMSIVEFAELVDGFALQQGRGARPRRRGQRTGLEM